jgi:hypothetical protein
MIAFPQAKDRVGSILHYVLKQGFIEGKIFHGRRQGEIEQTK